MTKFLTDINHQEWLDDSHSNFAKEHPTEHEPELIQILLLLNIYFVHCVSGVLLYALNSIDGGKNEFCFPFPSFPA